MCIHGQKAISRKSASNLSEGGAHKKSIHSHVLPAILLPSFGGIRVPCHPPLDLMEDIGAPQRVEHSFGSSPHWHQREREQEMEDETAMMEDFAMENFRLPQALTRSPPPQMKFETRVDSDSWRRRRGRSRRRLFPMQFRSLCGRDKQFPPTFPLLILGTFAISAVGFGEIQSATERESREQVLSFPIILSLSLFSVIFLSCRFPLPTDFSKENTSRSVVSVADRQTQNAQDNN